ncbi:MAG: AAA family ATPase, partial [Woeseia sp.]|nr:AAA family ATPase [Woeseia sp.]
DHEAMLTLREEFDDVVNDAVKRFTGKLIERSGVTYELLFGYPTAYENDALRACAAAFAINLRLGSMMPDVSTRHKASIVGSIGIHSDIVVIEKTAGDEDEITIVGDASQVAAWLQTLAPPGSIILSEKSQRLLRGKVRAESLGVQKNLRTSAGMKIFRAEALVQYDSAVAAIESRTSRMLGRNAELAMLLDRWELAKGREDQFVLVRGEPGIGKSTLIGGFSSRVRQEKSARIVSLYCSPFETSSAFYPVVEYFLGSWPTVADEVVHEAQSNRISELLDKAGLDAADTESLRSVLLAIAATATDRDGPTRRPEDVRKDLLRSLQEYFAALAEQNPVVLIVEDIHWADPSTLEFIDMIMSGGAGLGVLSLLTARPGTNFDWTARPGVLVLDLQRLSRGAIESMIYEVAGEFELSKELVGKIIIEADGNPLFAEELTRAITDTGLDTADVLVLPGTIYQSLESRMDKLGDAQPLLQLCSLLGTRFDYELLVAVSKTEDEKALQRDLRAIVNAGLLFQEGAVPDCSYRFKHILMQETAHGTLLKATRVEQHARIAEIVESQFPQKAKRNPGLLAYHYAEGGQPEKATLYWLQACKKSMQAYAVREGLEQADSGLQQLALLPAGTQRDQLEVTLLSMRGKGLMALRGYSDPIVEETFAKALKLTERLDDTPQMFQLAVGLWMYFFIAGDAEHALALARRLRSIAEGADSPAKSLQSRYCLGYALFRLGRFYDAVEQFDLALADETEDADFSSESASGDDTRVHLRVVLAHVLWHLGEDKRSLQMASEARELADTLGNPFGVVFALFMSSWLHLLRREPAECAAHAATCVRLAEERGFHFWVPLGNYMEAWSTCDGGRAGDEASLDARVEAMENSLLKHVSAGARNGEVSLALQIAEDRIAMGRVEQGLTWLSRAERTLKATGEQFFQPDALRVRALLAAGKGDDTEAAATLAAAQSMAFEMGSASLAQRAASDLARLTGLSAESADSNPVGRSLQRGMQASSD